MGWNQTELTYRRAAVQNASPATLVITLYDALVVDLQKAIDAFRSGKIEERCQHSKHALTILQLLEGSLDQENGGEMGASLSRFYSYVRAKLLEAQFKQSVETLQRQIELILDVRSAWQQKEAQSLPSTAAGAPEPPLAQVERVSGEWSA